MELDLRQSLAIKEIIVLPLAEAANEGGDRAERRIAPGGFRVHVSRVRRRGAECGGSGARDMLRGGRCVERYQLEKGEEERDAGKPK